MTDAITLSNTDFTMFAIKITEGRRPGKEIRRFAPPGFGEDFSSMVESLNYVVKEVIHYEDYMEALIKCHSCQSNSPVVRNLFFDVWSNIQGVKFISLIENKSGNIVARCLINETQKTHAPIYGEKHYLLENRLRYFKFKLGSVASYYDIFEVVKTTVSIPTVKASMYSVSPPKSISYDNCETLYPTSMLKLSATKSHMKAAIARLKHHVDVEPPPYDPKANYIISNREVFIEKTMRADECIEEYTDMVSRYKRYKKHINKSKKVYGDLINVSSHISEPVSKHWEFRKEDYIVYYPTSLYDDGSKQFVAITSISPAGWYRNTVDRDLG